MILERPARNCTWTRLARKKWYSGEESQITAADFDQVIGHAVAVTDSPATCFAPELIQAYPDAKVVLNLRRDIDAWHRSAMKSLVQNMFVNWTAIVLSCFNAEFFWVYHIYARFFWPRLFRVVDQSPTFEIASNGKSIYRGECRERPLFLVINITSSSLFLSCLDLTSTGSPCLRVFNIAFVIKCCGQVITLFRAQ